jgi:hypothetical protein
VAAVLLPGSASKDTCAVDSEPEVEGIELT